MLLELNIDLDKTKTKTKTYFAFCAIGNSDLFFTRLQANGLKLAGYKTFPDHHYYSDDCKYLQNQACSLHATLITTSKDYFKIYNKLLAENLEIELSIYNQELLQNLIYEKKFKIKHIIEYILFLAIINLIKLLGVDRSANLCSKLTKKLDHYYQSLILLKKNYHQQVINELWDNFGRFIGEFPYMPDISKIEI